MTSAIAAIPRSASFQSATRARAVVSAGPARAPHVQPAASRTAASLVRSKRSRMLVDYAAMEPIDKGVGNAVLAAPPARDGWKERGQGERACPRLWRRGLRAGPPT